MLPSVGCNADVSTNTGRASNTGRGSEVIVLIEAWGFYSRIYGTLAISVISTKSMFSVGND